MVEYLTDYEKRYELPVERPVRVLGVHRDGGLLRVETDSGTWHAPAVISATGTWWRPFLPAVPGQAAFEGRQPHTVEYRSPADFAGQRVTPRPTFVWRHPAEHRSARVHAKPGRHRYDGYRDASAGVGLDTAAFAPALDHAQATADALVSNCPIAASTLGSTR
ncbi:NAD(P)-binding domain-containing protein [Streptomyces sp. NPDC006602]|uniref:NAD(P)-binding domain-containing protein n=1 Tax=Streptomyces sp. NPDC006602 TaxID=3364751 RepID=UPI0036751992